MITQNRSGYFFQQHDLSGDEHVLLFHDGSVLLRDDEFLWPMSSLQQLDIRDRHYLLVGKFGDRTCVAITLGDEQLRGLNVTRLSPRELLLRHSLDNFTVVGQANQLLTWLHHHRFCGVCGSRTIPHERERCVLCESCHLHFYPRINPCVIVLVCRGDEMLLARHARASSPYFSCLAGFMEIGETPEATVAREIREEVGIEVRNIRYIRSQSWPFPSQLMLGFFADYDSGEIQIDGQEIAEANWYKKDALPLVPSAGISVAGQLIELFLQPGQHQF